MASSQAVEDLQQALPDSRFVFRGSEEYDDLNKTYQSALNVEIHPSCIFLPKSNEDISAFLKHVGLRALSGEIPIAIYGAGCQPLRGCANVQNGITVNLSSLKGLTIGDGRVSIAAGERWGSVYEELGKKGLGVAGGRSAKSGIGGLALEGGLSFQSSRHGFVCDNVINYEVVLASGEIVNANGKENVNLFRALRGGGNNFGIVTRFDFPTFEQGPMYGGSVYYFAPSFPEQIQHLVDELQKPEPSKDTHLMISTGYAAMFGPQMMCQNQLYHNHPEENPAVLRPFTSVSPQLDQLNSMRVLSLAEAAKEQAEDSPVIQRSAYFNTTLKADARILQEAAEIYTAGLEPIKPCQGLICSMKLQPYAHSLLDASTAQGGNSLGLSPANGPLVSVLLLTYWTNKSDEAAVLETMKTILGSIKSRAAARDLLVPYTYMNYAFASQNPIGSYGAENKAELQRVSRRYDPQGLFQKGVPGGFKLFP
ncbi:FAD-binding domain-containing protein [Apiospora saccharicola]|uniref:FAD-binding domain-containing protein n=1 Tax=Apiospora saccharicola TaxID=335842 RepID=A0ABR1THU7_9PEZI